MLTNVFNLILNRLIRDAHFRNDFLENPLKATSEYNLKKKEKNKLLNMPLLQIKKVNAAFDQWILGAKYINLDIAESNINNPKNLLGCC